MKHTWQLQEAKARLSELVRSAEQEGPQAISVRGEPVAVVVSQRDFERMTGKKPTFFEFLRRSPLVGVELEIRRDRSPVRRPRL